MQLVFHLVPQPSVAQRFFNQFFLLGFTADQVVHAWCVSDIFKDRLRKRIRLLEHHTHPAAERHFIHFRCVNVQPIHLDQTFGAYARNQVVHTIQAA